jgi:hypothetical protein
MQREALDLSTREAPDEPVARPQGDARIIAAHACRVDRRPGGRPLAVEQPLRRIACTVEYGLAQDLVRDARAQSQITHGHLRPQVCCALYCLWARRTRQGVTAAWSDAVETVRRIYDGGSAARAELEWRIRPDEPSEDRGSGYVVDGLRSARLAVNAGTYEVVVKAAIALGHDTDTTACVAGGVRVFAMECTPHRSAGSSSCEGRRLSSR